MSALLGFLKGERFQIGRVDGGHAALARGGEIRQI
jgi:hypothetical protein